MLVIYAATSIGSIGSSALSVAGISSVALLGTTAPANAMAVYQAKQQGVLNSSVLVSPVLVPPAVEAILSSPRNRWLR